MFDFVAEIESVPPTGFEDGDTCTVRVSPVEDGAPIHLLEVTWSLLGSDDEHVFFPIADDRKSFTGPYRDGLGSIFVTVEDDEGRDAATYVVPPSAAAIRGQCPAHNGPRDAATEP